jgi:hypothetical protein
MANELSSISQVFTTQEALARVSKLESEGKIPLRVARREFIDMWLACWPSRFKNMVVEWENCKAKVFSGNLDLQDITEVLYLLLWAWIVYKIGEIFGRGSIFGYRFDGEEHTKEAQNAQEFLKQEAIESEKRMAVLEKEIAEWMAKMEAENK